MAEVAAGAGVALAAEEIITHGAEAGVAAYMVAKPTMPLKATYTRIATTDDDSSRRSLVRSNHTLTVIANKAYIFGGETAHDGVASNDVHAITIASSGKPDMDYSLIPAVPRSEVDGDKTLASDPTEKGGKVPKARTKHSACSFRHCVAIYGGIDENGDSVAEGSSIWLFDPEFSAWSFIMAADPGYGPGPRSEAKLSTYKNFLVTYGGKGPTGEAMSDLWRLNADTREWEQLPNAPTATSNATFANGQLYLISGSDPMSIRLHHVDITVSNEEMEWNTFIFPTSPIAPGPRPRQEGGFLPITTGYGRNYIVYFLGSKEKTPGGLPPPEDETHDVTQWSDMWTLQIPSSSLEPKASLSISQAIKPAKIKDAIRSMFGADSGNHSWAEVEVQPPADFQITEGKVHPGPRRSFGADVMENGRSVVFWGGEDAKGQRVGDGWIVKLE